MFSGNNAVTGRVHGLRPLVCNSEITYRFWRLIISSRKKLYRVTSMSRTIAKYPPNQTFVCSQIEVLNCHLPSSTNSGNKAGLQNFWQWVSVSLCLLVKWNTSTGFPVFWKCVSPMARWCLSSWQLLSKTRYSGVDSGDGNVAFANVWWQFISLTTYNKDIFSYMNSRDGLWAKEGCTGQNNTTRTHDQLFIMSTPFAKISSQTAISPFRFPITF